MSCAEFVNVDFCFFSVPLSRSIVLFELRERFSVNREFRASLHREGGLCRKNPR